MSVLVIDPGKKVGFSIWTELGEERERGVIDIDDLPDWLMRNFIDDPITVLVYEDYIGYKNQSHNGRQTGSRFVAPQAIGMLKMYALPRQIRMVRQPANILGVSAMHTGYKIPAGHLPDQDAAFLHGHYFFVVEGILKSRDLW